MLWLKRILRWIFGSLIVCFVLLFRERNKYLAKICKKIGKQQKFNKKNEMITRKIRRGRRRYIIYVEEVNVIVTYIFHKHLLLLNIHQLFLHQIHINFTIDFQTN